MKLGRTQVLVLRLLANRAMSAQEMERNWPGLTASAARSAALRLGHRSLVDMAGFDGNSRTYCLTAKGVVVERSLNVSHDDDSEDTAS